jgi:hypothetical protein
MVVVQVFLEPVVEMFAEIGPGTAGVQALNTVVHVNDERRRVQRVSETWHALLLADLNDLRGGPDGSGQVAIGSKVLSCSDCETEGVYVTVYRKCIYPGAVRWLERDDNLRDVYEEVFAQWPELARLAREPMPVLVTDSYVKSAMEAAEVSPFKVDSARRILARHLASRRRVCL